MSNNKLKLSYSKVQIYKECPKKYWFQVVEKYTVNNTSAALLFGISLDLSLNYILTQHQKNKKISTKRAKSVFLKEMKTWNGQNELVFFKSEIPEEDFIADDSIGNQWRCWDYLCKIGQMMIDSYVENILPQIKKVHKVQHRESVVNEEGDTFTFVLDCILELNDGRIVLTDNKSASRPYPKNSVKKSEQLAIYNEFHPTPYCGYVVFHKRLKDNKVTWQFLIDKIDEEKKEVVFQDIDKALHDIKAKKFSKNFKACYAYGRRCIYFEACKNGDYSGLIKNE